MTLDELLGLRSPKGDVEVDVDGTVVRLTSLDRVYWPAERLTKHDLLVYYVRAWPRISPFLVGRPGILQRYPRGTQAPKFFQHELHDAPDFVRVERFHAKVGREIDFAVYSSLASLLYLVNLGTIEHHPWHSRVSAIDRPDWLALDLDPHGAPWRNVVAAALAIRDVLADLGLTGFPKTSGSSGIHVYVPIVARYGYDRVASVAEEIAAEVASRLPKIATVERSIAKRSAGQVYVDWLQNARGKSMAAPFSVRGRPGATVSMPLTWTQVERGAKVSSFTFENALARVARSGDPWEHLFESRQTLPSGTGVAKLKSRRARS